MSADAIREVVRLTAEAKDLEAQLKRKKEELQRAKWRALDWIERNESPSMSVGDKTVYLKRELWASVPAGMDLRAAFTAAGIGHLVKDGVNVNQLSAHVRQLDANGEKLPPALAALVTVTEKFDVIVMNA